jgi:hypothetical protein
VSLQDGTPPGELNGTIQLRSRLTPSNVFGRPLPALVVANPPTATSIPSVISLPSPDRIVVATAANPSFAANEIDISVVAGTPDSVLEALASSENATFWGRDSRARIYQLRFAFPDFLTALTLAQRLTNSYRFVEFATPSLLFGPFSTMPPDPSWDPSVRADQSWAQLLIDLPNAWDFGTGDVHVRLAVVDSGFVTRPDLNPAPPPESEPDGTDPGHGVAVASLAAAVGNNPGRPIGLAGAMWSSHMVELAASGDDNLAVSRMLDATDQAKISQDNQGMVINFSGGNDLSPTCFPGIPDAARQYAVSLQKLLWEKPIEYAMANGQQVLFVFSAGNDRVLFDNSLPAAA